MNTVLSSWLVVLLITVALGACSRESEQARSKKAKSGSRVAEYTISIDRQVVTVKTSDIKGLLEKAMSRPAEQTGNTKPTRVQIKALAREIGLLDETRTNPHLSFLDGDIAYWYEQGLSLDHLTLQFVARKTVLDAADRDQVIIDDQGKLSWASQQIMAAILSQRTEMRKEKNK